MASRIPWRLGAIVGGLCLALSCGPGAQHDSPDAVARAYLTAWQQNDVPGMLACFTPEQREQLAPYERLLEETIRIADDNRRERPQVQSFEIRTTVPVREGEGVDVGATILMQDGVLWRSRLRCRSVDGDWYFESLVVDEVDQQSGIRITEEEPP